MVTLCFRDGLLLVSGLRGHNFDQCATELHKLLEQSRLLVENILAVQLFVRDLRNPGMLVLAVISLFCLASNDSAHIARLYRYIIAS